MKFLARGAVYNGICVWNSLLVVSFIMARKNRIPCSWCCQGLIDPKGEEGM